MPAETVPNADLITAAFQDFCDQNGLTVLVPNIDRHGSIEWSAAQRGSLNRYLSLSFTPRAGHQSSLDTVYQMEIWYLVDNTHRYIRKRASSSPVVLGVISTTALLAKVSTRLHTAWHTALAVAEEDLSEAILFPIYGQGAAEFVPPEPDREARRRVGRRS